MNNTRVISPPVLEEQYSDRRNNCIDQPLARHPGDRSVDTDPEPDGGGESPAGIEAACEVLHRVLDGADPLAFYRSIRQKASGE